MFSAWLTLRALHAMPLKLRIEEREEGENEESLLDRVASEVSSGKSVDPEKLWRKVFQSVGTTEVDEDGRDYQSYV
ncbi:hypothetical protein [Thermofilum pendens]|uniref:Uncharacterized protein n=1 Tax=Thermofilum pendens (strain DSM 2475 / Hrk 5) TaxID=368408 RepID=A1RWJ3_THEPD|nr:hypothetical protein [Thermofilum pendens]ABL77573.1 hypothetical protein Tpen_0163 [Thermofilum pendens Hrk 5]